jgi:exocyst complex component 5
MERLESSDLPASQKAMLVRIAGLKDSDSEMKNKGEIEVSDEDGELNLQNVKRMLKWMAEGVGRGLELSAGNETPKDVQALLNLLLSHMGAVYLEGSLDAASDSAASQENAKNEPDLSYLPSLRAAVSTLHLLQSSINTVLLPLASPNLTIRREIEKTTNNALNGIEGKISSILQRTLDVSLGWVTRVLAQQKKSDFRPKDDAASAALMDSLQTPTCNSVATFLTSVASLAAGALDGKNLACFLAELATGLRGALLDHLRKFSVSLAGGLIVSKDVTKYVELVRGWPTGDEFKGGMDIVVEIANLYVIGPEALRERLRNAPESAELRAYVLRREDANSVGVQSVLNSV